MLRQSAEVVLVWANMHQLFAICFAMIGSFTDVWQVKSSHTHVHCRCYDPTHFSLLVCSFWCQLSMSKDPNRQLDVKQ